MRRRVLAGLLLVALAVPILPLFATAAEDCPCSKAVCCCGPKAPNPQRASCHGATSSTIATMRCHHPGRDTGLPSIVALLPMPTVGVRASRESAKIVLSPVAVRPGFFRIDTPPPRSLDSPV